MGQSQERSQTPAGRRRAPQVETVPAPTFRAGASLRGGRARYVGAVRLTRSFAAALSVLVLGAAGRSFADEAPAPAHPLAGKWKLDTGLSTDLTEVLTHFGANFVVRHFAKRVAPVNTITFGADRLEVKVEASGVTKTTPIVLDGKTETNDELFGNPYAYTSVREGEAVVSQGAVTLEGGKKERLALRRAVEADGRMVLAITLYQELAAPLVVKRVFNRLPK